MDTHEPSLEVADDMPRLSQHQPDIIPADDDRAAIFLQAGCVTSSAASNSAGVNPADSNPAARRFVRGGAGIVIIVAASALTGMLTPIGEQLLPHAVRSMANSSGPWAMVAFAAIYFGSLRSWRAAAMGVVSFLTMDLSFFVVFESLGMHYPHHFLAFWMGVGILIGPVIGLAASWLRADNIVSRVVAVAEIPAVLVGEGVFMLVRLPGESTVYAIASLVVGVGLFVVASRYLLRRARPIALGIAMSLGGAAAFFFVYGLIPLLLNKVVP
jgi:hypothetical protein